MQSLSEVWVVERVTRGWDGPPTITIVKECYSERDANEYCRNADMNNDLGSSTWHRAKKVTKSVSYY